MPNKKVKLFISAKIQPLSNKAMVYKSSSQQPLLTFDRNNSILHPTVAQLSKANAVRTQPHGPTFGPTHTSQTSVVHASRGTPGPIRPNPRCHVLLPQTCTFAPIPFPFTHQWPCIPPLHDYQSPDVLHLE